MIRKIYRFLASVKLAMTLLVVILVCCVVGVTILRGQRAWTLVFNTLWFNSLLVLLVVNVVFCFFPRMWGRKLTMISLGMILFHLSFVAILGGIVYNSLFYFRGFMRLTEGEALPSGKAESYDVVDHGRFFDYAKLKGETSLVKMHRDYRIDGKNKRAAYEIAVGEPNLKKQGILYITKPFDYNGFTYFNDREGYSIAVVIQDRQERELYGAHIPLQSIRQRDNTYLYTTGTKDAPGRFLFPQRPLNPLFYLQLAYYPSALKERAGDVYFRIWPLRKAELVSDEKPLVDGKVAVGEKLDSGTYYLLAEEVRYWVGMNVRYEPGKPIVLTSLWVGFGGVLMTFIGRSMRRRGD